jgi:LysM repeat protein
LKKAGYATNPRYAQVLIKLIEDFKLQEYTYAALDNRIIDKEVAEVIPTEDAAPKKVIRVKKEEPWAQPSGNIKIAELAPEPFALVVDQPESFPPYGQLVKVNGLKAVYARKGDMPLEHAIEHNIRYERLLEINEIADRPLQHDMYLYLERKRFKGLKPAHTVKAGETLAKISQYEGMQMKYLRSLNHLLDGEEPAEGETLHLQEHAIAKPKLKGATVATNIQPTPPVTARPVAQSQPEPEYVATGNTPGEEPQVQYAVNTQVAEQPIEMGPIPTPEAVKVNEPIISDELPANLPPAPAEEPVVKAGPVTVSPPVNIANEKPVEEVIAEAKEKKLEPQEDAEPQDELAALKAKFDKVVYAPKSAPVEPPQDAPVVEQPDATPVVKEEPKPAANASGARFYMVKKGDTAFGIAKRNNITVKELMDWNNLDFEGIKVGQKLRVKP